MITEVVFMILLAALAEGVHIQSSIRSGQVPCRGVNLGGWLVSEHWINSNDALWGPPLNSTIIDKGEYGIMKFLGHSVGDPRFQKHWDTFINETDIQQIANYGLNCVRVPIGFWIIGYDNFSYGIDQWKVYPSGGLFYLDRLINQWANKYNVAVLVDIHAAKGSQNGEGNSQPTVNGQVYWDGYQENIDNTVEVARFIAARYKNSPAFLGIDLLNEPINVNPQKLKDYYQKVHQVVRATGNTCILSASSLLYDQQPYSSNHWELLTQPPTYTNAWQAWHLYLIWGYEQYGQQWLIVNGTAGINSAITNWNNAKGNPMFVGEWSLASSKYFNNSMLTVYGGKMFQALKAAKAGWTYWNWKVSFGGGWSMKWLLDNGIINKTMWA